ncbi:MAG TPA: ester cyclase [Polyangiales bacterium]|nr:ester cyclase [Polyangiales bacterium]
MADTAELIRTPEECAVAAKNALERVCSGAGLDPASRYYSPAFCDHVNDLEFHGIEGIRRSIAMYKAVLSDISIKVEEQLIQGDRVSSRFVVRGVSGGRRVHFNGITISRFENGLIVEDWSVTDTLSMLKQLGVWRSLTLAIRSWRSMSSPRPSSRTIPRRCPSAR